jgi:hypothetical protein
MPTVFSTANAPTFRGDEAMFQEWINMIDNVAARSYKGGQHVKYEIVSDIERAGMEADGEIDIDNLITEPDLPDADDANATLQYKRDVKKWEEYSQALHDFSLWFYSLIAQEVLTHVSHVRNVDFANLPIREMRSHLLEVYGTPSHATNRAQFNLVHIPFTAGDDLIEHIKKFDKTFAFFQRTEPIPDFYKYELLVRSMATHDAYSTYISQYEIAGTQTYGALSRALLAHLSERATANAVRAMHQATAAPAPLTAAAVSESSQIPQGYKLVKPAHYCWTHGNGFHTSSECKSRKTGHKDKATLSNRMGGSSDKADPRIVKA